MDSNHSLRNPWHGINAWKEFKYDCAHPVRFVKGAIANVNNVDPTMRRLGLVIMIVGLLNVAIGIVIIARTGVHGFHFDPDWTWFK